MRATDSLETLLSVQTLDKKLADLERRRDEIPSVKADVSREITALEHESAEQAAALAYANPFTVTEPLAVAGHAEGERWLATFDGNGR